MKKPSLTFANFICLLIVLFSFGYYGYITVLAFSHTSIPAIVTEIKGDVNIWATAAIMYQIGSTQSSKAKDQTISDALAATPPAPAIVSPVTPAAPVQVVTEPAAAKPTV